MSCLVILEMENGLPNRPSLATVTASKKIAEEIDVLILENNSLIKFQPSLLCHKNLTILQLSRSLIRI